jgi:5-formyltetrahydrofolate cyclo-ligase
MTDKKALRAAEKQRRAQQDSVYWQRIGDAAVSMLREQLALWLCDQPIIAGFAALPGEPILRDLPGRSAWPAVEGDDLVFRACGREDLVPGRWGIFEPPASAPLVVPDLILVPGLAFAPNGDRLGRGKGFYDRYLSGSKALTLGITDQAGLRDQIPKASHDVAVFVVLTEVGAYEADNEERNDGDGICGGRFNFRPRCWTVRRLEQGENTVR